MTNEERDLNDVFDDIVLTEQSITKTSYEEGFEQGVKEGNLEGYKLGYAKGVDLGAELGIYYGTVIAYLHNNKSEKIKKHLESLKIKIENFSKTNDPEIDIISEVENIRTQYKKIRSILHLPSEEPNKDLTF